MTYQEIKNLVQEQKTSSPKMTMAYMPFGRFVVMWSNTTDPIIVDSDIAEIVVVRRWCVDSGGYPVANCQNKTVRLHDFVMAMDHNIKPKGCFVDHINYDKLDNRRANLRFVTPIESTRNMPMRSNNKTNVIGVSKTKNNTFRAYITYNKKQVNLGYFKTKEEAIAARAEAEHRFGFKTRPRTIEELCNNAFLCEMEKVDNN